MYRDGSRDSQCSTWVLARILPSSGVPRPRPAVTVGRTEKVKIGCGNLYIVSRMTRESAKSLPTPDEAEAVHPSQATSRLVSIALRSGISVDSIVEQLRGIRCSACIRQPGAR